jgi:hypothetical protein
MYSTFYIFFCTCCGWIRVWILVMFSAYYYVMSETVLCYQYIYYILFPCHLLVYVRVCMHSVGRYLLVYINLKFSWFPVLCCAAFYCDYTDLFRVTGIVISVFLVVVAHISKFSNYSYVGPVLYCVVFSVDGVYVHLKLKLKLVYDRQSVGQSVLVSGTHLGPATNFSFSTKFPSDSSVFVIL